MPPLPPLPPEEEAVSLVPSESSVPLDSSCGEVEGGVRRGEERCRGCRGGEQGGRRGWCRRVQGGA